MGKIAKDDHVGWLRKRGAAVRQSAEKATDEKQRMRLEETSARLFGAADALELAQAGLNAEATSGFRAAAWMLRRGTRVEVRLVNGAAWTGVMGPIGKYDFVLVRDDGREMLVAKHGVLYWELMDEVDGVGREGQDLRD